MITVYGIGKIAGPIRRIRVQAGCYATCEWSNRKQTGDLVGCADLDGIICVATQSPTSERPLAQPSGEQTPTKVGATDAGR